MSQVFIKSIAAVFLPIVLLYFINWCTDGKLVNLLVPANLGVSFILYFLFGFGAFWICDTLIRMNVVPLFEFMKLSRSNCADYNSSSTDIFANSTKFNFYAIAGTPWVEIILSTTLWLLTFSVIFGERSRILIAVIFGIVTGILAYVIFLRYPF